MRVQGKLTELCNFIYSYKFTVYTKYIQLYLNFFKLILVKWLKSENKEKFQSLLNCVPCLLKTCSRANVPCVSTCLACVRANVRTCLACLRAHLPTCLACTRANMACVLTCSRANVPCLLTCSRVNVLVLMPLFSVSLPLLLKLYTLLVRFKSLITAFPQ